MPLLTHDETGAASVAREGALALAERTTTAGGSGRPVTPVPPSSGRSPWRRVRRVLYVLLGLAVIGPFLAFAIGWMIFSVPSSDEATLTQVATFTFQGGEPLATVRPEENNVRVNRQKVTLDRIPLHTRQAVVATEDNTFYSNPGFDITGIFRAVYNQLTGGIGGGSTITQQYVKVSTGHDENSLWRKYKEVVLAVKISREQTKDQILENYLNTIYLGRGAYGIQAASKAYFDKDVQDLTVSESAMIAGIISAPSAYDPAKSEQKSTERWNRALDRMVENKFLAPAERAQQTFPTNWSKEPPAVGAGVPDDDRYHIYEKAVEELAAKGITQDQIDTEGLTITTTVQQPRQAQAVDAIKKVMKGQPENLRTALVSVDPKTGAILAYYGGANGLGTDYANAMRQPGSSFKPFVLTAALESNEGIGLGSTYDGSSPQTLAGRVVNNSEGFDCDKCTVQTAMTKSINTIFYRMGLDVGPQKVVDAAHKAGIPDDLLPQASGGIALGDKEVHPVDMASAFATFAADGERHEPYIVSKVVAADGRVLYDRGDAAAQQVISEQVARNVTESMIDVASSSRIGLFDGRPVAAKTGTVQLPGSKDQNKDAWTVGYTPSISTAVWVGSDLSDPIKNAAGSPIFGRMLPGSIWQQFMNDALRGTPKEQFSKFVPMGVPPAADPATNPSPSGSLSPSGSPGDDSEENDGRGRGNGNGRGNSDDDSNGNSDDNSNSDSSDGGGPLFPPGRGDNGDSSNTPPGGGNDNPDGPDNGNE